MGGGAGGYMYVHQKSGGASERCHQAQHRRALFTLRSSTPRPDELPDRVDLVSVWLERMVRVHCVGFRVKG